MQECTKMINRNVQKILHKSVQVCFGSYRRNMKLVTKARQEEKMNISINRDIEKYQETVVMGLTARQLIFSIASIACSSDIQTRGTYGKCIHCNSRGGTTCLKRILFISGNELYPDVNEKNVVCIQKQTPHIYFRGK